MTGVVFQIVYTWCDRGQWRLLHLSFFYIHVTVRRYRFLL